MRTTVSPSMRCADGGDGVHDARTMSIVRWRGLPSRTTSRCTRPPALPDSIESSSQSARLRVSWPSSFSITSSLLTPAAAAGLPSVAATTTGKPKRRARTIPVSTTSFFCFEASQAVKAAIFSGGTYSEKESRASVMPENAPERSGLSSTGST
jgi:hypothetical protein